MGITEPATAGATEGVAVSATPAPARAGVGFSEQARSREAGAEAAAQALERLGRDGCDFVLLFSTCKHDPAQLHEGVRSVVGPRARIFGGYGGGIITNDRLGYEGLQVGVAAVSAPGTRVDAFIEHGLPDNEFGVGLALGRQIAGQSTAAEREGEPNLLVFYDIVKQGLTDAGTSLNMATPLLAGMTQALGSWPRTAGGGLAGGASWLPTYQWFDDRIVQQSALALVLSGALRMDTIVIHGCRPTSGYYTVTKADGNVILELDDRPAVPVINELTGTDWMDWPLGLILGVNNGDPYGEYREDDYAVRLCMAVDEARGGLAMFGDDLQAGTRVQLMRKAIDFAYVRERVEALQRRVGGRRPVMALYVDCIGRESHISGTDGEEAEEVQRALGPGVPLLGFYSGCEIARSGAAMQSHNYTGVLSILSE